MSLLKQDTTKKGRVNKNATKFDVSNNNSRKYKVKVILDNAIYTKESKSGHLLDF